MSKKRIYIYSILAIAALSVWIFSTKNEQQKEFSEKVKIALRDVGNKLLLSEQDSTSLILPIKEIENYSYKLSFQKQLTFEPHTMVSIIAESFKRSKLPEKYRVEVLQCTDEEVAYSYEMSLQEENTIIPCISRYLPSNCYTIHVRFTSKTASVFTISALLYGLILLLFIVMELFFFRKKPSKNDNQKASDETTENYATIGSFYFYPTQNKLVKQATEINLSKKECELLQIFAANLNQVVTRDELTKKVWEDNGVIVGRSLDTYISKLRKKLKEDDRIKITNVHGVGYKLELDR